MLYFWLACALSITANCENTKGATMGMTKNKLVVCYGEERIVLMFAL